MATATAPSAQCPCEQVHMAVPVGLRAPHAALPHALPETGLSPLRPRRRARSRIGHREVGANDR